MEQEPRPQEDNKTEKAPENMAEKPCAATAGPDAREDAAEEKAEAFNDNPYGDPNRANAPGENPGGNQSATGGFNNNPYGDPNAATPCFTPAGPQIDRSNGMGIASLVLGILSLLLCCCYGFGILLAIPAVILAIVDGVKYRKMCGYDIAGLIFGIIGFLLGAITLICLAIAVSSPEFKEILDEILRESNTAY